MQFSDQNRIKLEMDNRRKTGISKQLGKKKYSFDPWVKEEITRKIKKKYTELNKSKNAMYLWGTAKVVL